MFAFITLKARLLPHIHIRRRSKSVQSSRVKSRCLSNEFFSTPTPPPPLQPAGFLQSRMDLGVPVSLCCWLLTPPPSKHKQPNLLEGGGQAGFSHPGSSVTHMRAKPQKSDRDLSDSSGAWSRVAVILTIWNYNPDGMSGVSRRTREYISSYGLSPILTSPRRKR